MNLSAMSDELIRNGGWTYPQLWTRIFLLFFYPQWWIDLSAMVDELVHSCGWKYFYFIFPSTMADRIHPPLRMRIFLKKFCPQLWIEFIRSCGRPKQRCLADRKKKSHVKKAVFSVFIRNSIRKTLFFAALGGWNCSFFSLGSRIFK